MTTVLGLVVTFIGSGDLYSPCEAVEDCDDFVSDSAAAECLDKSGQRCCTWNCNTNDDCADDHD